MFYAGCLVIFNVCCSGFNHLFVRDRGNKEKEGNVNGDGVSRLSRVNHFNVW